MTNAAWGAPLRQIRGLFARGMSAGATDAHLLARYAASGDGHAFEALVARHGAMVAATCRAILRNEHDAEDAFQATFLVLAQKAGALRAGDALGGWLHRVAYRAAVQASAQARRRRECEAEAFLMATRGRAGGDADAQHILHEEIERLPERHRLPIILCDLEGLTYEEAAGRLGLTPPALRNRLSRARERLRRRFSSRGVPAAILAAALSPPSHALVPVSWSKAAVASAVGGAAPAGAVLISQLLLEGMLMTRIKIAAVALLGTSVLASAAVVAAGRHHHVPPEPVPGPPGLAEAPPAPPREDPPRKPPGDGEMIEVRGIVLDPAGKPVPGATVVSRLPYSNQGPVKSVAGPDGRFAIAVPKRVFSGPEAQYLPMVPWLTASSPDSGFGVGDNDPAGRGDPKAEQIVRLVPDGRPIEGRILDLEGRPVAGARVAVRRAWFDPNSPGDLGPWLAKIRSGAVRGIWQDLHNFPVEIEALAGPDGRFRIAGVGHDRVADLVVTGPTIASTKAFVMTRDEPEIRTVDKAMFAKETFLVHAPRFELAAAPTRPIEGTARDKDTGEPIAGLKVRGMVFEEGSLVFPEGIEATTDAEGRYRLTGLARGAAYRLEFIPPETSPYLRSSLKATPSATTGPVAFDVAMRRGAVLRGRVVDKATGAPATGWIEAMIFDETPRDGYPGAYSGYSPRSALDSEGRFTLAVLPGRGLLLVRGDDVLYRGARGFETIPGFDPKYRSFNTRPHIASPGGYHAVVEIQPALGAEPGPIEIALDPGLTVKVKAVDPEGRPIGGTTVKGLGELFTTAPMPIASPEFEVHSLDPSTPRRVVITHQDRKLIGSVCLKGDEAGPVVVTLAPWGIVAGRVVDDEGKPLANIRLQSPSGSANKSPEDTDILPGSDWNAGLILGDDGRFRIEGLVPGLKYGASASAGMTAGGSLFRDVVVAPGEVTDLGDLKIIPRKPEED